MGEAVPELRQDFGPWEMRDAHWEYNKPNGPQGQGNSGHEKPEIKRRRAEPAAPGPVVQTPQGGKGAGENADKWDGRNHFDHML